MCPKIVSYCTRTHAIAVFILSLYLSKYVCTQRSHEGIQLYFENTRKIVISFVRNVKITIWFSSFDPCITYRIDIVTMPLWFEFKQYSYNKLFKWKLKIQWCARVSTTANTLSRPAQNFEYNKSNTHHRKNLQSHFSIVCVCVCVL